MADNAHNTDRDPQVSQPNQESQPSSHRRRSAPPGLRWSRPARSLVRVAAGRVPGAAGFLARHE